MDMLTCIKSMVESVHAYRTQANNDNLQDLINKLEVLNSISLQKESLVNFDCQQLCSSECISFLVTMVDISNLNDTTTTANATTKQNQAHPTVTQLLEKSIVVLTTIAHNESVRRTLIDNYNLISQASLFHVKEYTITGDTAISLKTLRLLASLTYDERIEVVQSFHMDLIKYLIDTAMRQKYSDLIILSLETLTNLCRNNIEVQQYTKSLDNIQVFFKMLTSHLAKTEMNAIAFSLCLLTYFCQYEKVGELLYSSKNTHQTVQFIMSLIIKPELQYRRRYIIDLFIDIIECPSIQNVLKRYKNLHSLLVHIISTLTDPVSSDNVAGPEIHAKILELLCAFFRQSAIKETVFEAVMSRVSMDKETKTIENSFKRSLSLHFGAILHWCESPVDKLNRKSPANFALSIVISVFECSIDLNSKKIIDKDGVGNCLLRIIKNNCNSLDLLPTSSQPRERGPVVHSSQACRVLSFMHRHSLLSDEINATAREFCLKLVDFEYNNNVMSIDQPMSHVIDTVCYDGANTLLYCLQFLLPKTLDDSNESDSDSADNVQRSLEDIRIVNYLCYGLKSSDKDILSATLDVLIYALNQCNFPRLQFFEQMIKSNKKNSSKSINNNNVTLPGVQISAGDQKELIDRLKNTMRIDELKSADMINLYEILHQRSSNMSKESTLQSSLDHAEQMLTEFRCRQENSKAMILQIKNMLFASEKREKEGTDKIENMETCYSNLKNESESKIESLNAKIEEMSTKNDDLIKETKLKEKKHEELKEDYQVSYNELNEKYKTLQTNFDKVNKITSMIHDLSKK